MRLPQRFQWKDEHGGPWRDGVCLPMVAAGVEYWSIRAGNGHGSFDDDPWEIMGMILSDVPAFRWIDNDHGWHPVGGTCCGTSYEDHSDLRRHLRGCDKPD